MKKSFWEAGHRPTLIAAFLYVDLAFMAWVLLGPLGVAISADLGLSPAQKGLMVATPTLAGALLRVVNGLLVDRIGPKRKGTIGQLIVIAGLSVARSEEHTSELQSLMRISYAVFCLKKERTSTREYYHDRAYSN